MRHIEQAFGVPLFTRSKNRIELNETGRLAVERARDLLREEQDALCRKEMPASKFLVQTDKATFDELVAVSSLPCFTSDYAPLRDGHPGRIDIPLTDDAAHFVDEARGTRGGSSRWLGSARLLVITERPSRSPRTVASLQRRARRGRRSRPRPIWR